LLQIRLFQTIETVKVSNEMKTKLANKVP
jgi:hypothetical protein